MTFVEAVKTCLSKYAIFDGRASRSEFWWFYLAYILFVIASDIVIKLQPFAQNIPVIILISLLKLGLVVPQLAVGIRRLHDTDHSGWFLLVPIYNLWLQCKRGTPGPNRFGDNPLGEGLAEVFS